MSALNEIVSDRFTPFDLAPDHPALALSLVSKYQGPDSTWFRAENNLNKSAALESEDHRIRMLVSRGLLYDVQHLKLDKKSIARVLRSRARLGQRDGAIEHLYRLFGFFEGVDPQDDEPWVQPASSCSAWTAKAADEALTTLATELAEVAKYDAEFVRKAMAGQLHWAAARAPVTAQSITGELYSTRGLVDLLEHLAHVHIVDSLCLSAEDAHRRLFETTGFDFLDFNGEGVRTTKGTILKRMDEQMALLADALKLYIRRGFIDPNDALLKRFQGGALERRAREIEAALTEWCGEALAAAIVRKKLKSLAKQIKLFRRALATLKGERAFRNQPACQDRGPDPHRMLALTVSIAVGWISTKEAPLMREQFTNEDDLKDAEDVQNRVSRLRQALEAASRRQAAVLPALAPQDHEHSTLVRRAFFYLRQIHVKDPDSKVSRMMRKHKELASIVDVFRRLDAEEAAKTIEQEGWADKFVSGTRTEYRAALAFTDDWSRAFVMEAQGRISLQLRS